jgi:prolipoprotein diacylglyceryltransferase
MVSSWGSYFLRDQDGDSASSGVITMTYAVMFGLSLILSMFLAKWQWRRSSQSTQMYEVLVTGTWMLICFLLSARPAI